jgi:lipid-binding SYLF domain-containing protein
MRSLISMLLAACAFALVAPAQAGIFADVGPFQRASKVRTRLDDMAQQTLDRLFEQAPNSRALYDRSIAYAVFDVTKVSLGVTGGGGTGVAVDKGTGQRTYMHMGTGGLNLGLGGQVFQLVFLFADSKSFQQFLDVGWDASASANAVAGRAGANAEASFKNGFAVYTLTEAGLMLQVDLSGTKYWKSKKLNPRT